MKVVIELSTDQVKKLIAQHIADKINSSGIHEKDVIIETKSTQNYKAEWETAHFRVKYEAVL